MELNWMAASIVSNIIFIAALFLFSWKEAKRRKWYLEEGDRQLAQWEALAKLTRQKNAEK